MPDVETAPSADIDPEHAPSPSITLADAKTLPSETAAVDPDATPSASEIIAQTGTEVPRWDPPPKRRFMSREGVEDPFPDRVRRARPHDAGILLGLGVGFAVASTITARTALLPDCEDERDIQTCAVPNAADIGLRSGRLVGTLGFSIGSMAFGAFGGRELGRLLQQGTGRSLEQRRRIAVGLGSGAVVGGLAGIAVGASLLGRGTARSLSLASEFENTDLITDPEVAARVDDTIAQIRVARIGLMVLVASPVLVTTGAALVANRPRRERLQITPTVSLDQIGVSATFRF